MSSTIALIESAQPISQGAEAKVYKAYLHNGGTPVLVKHRFRKQYRHPTLDATLTKSRVAGEARALLKCLRAGVNVPGVRMVDSAEGVLCIEWIDGQSVRKLLPGGEEEEELDDATDLTGESSQNAAVSSLRGYDVDELMSLIGREIGKMHQADIVHGDLTTSNMMLHSSSQGQRPRLVRL
ncbi:hypothetical protein HGRIS_010595 [Hohenbuehelia grisea]|uniref:non-specific serine/threonine protein kinase n=1 Tax=Hohenbuehelia grisea TaxID=104357 RepID=A0ABR3IXB9_9AGAR